MNNDHPAWESSKPAEIKGQEVPQHPIVGTFAKLTIVDSDAWLPGPWKLLAGTSVPAVGFLHLGSGDFVPVSAVTYAKRA